MVLDQLSDFQYFTTDTVIYIRYLHNFSNIS